MKTAIFNYPEHFESLPDYTAHRGQCVEVGAEVSRDEYDFEGEMMFHITAADGWAGMAWESELAVQA